jgi:hypothetical protein
MRLHKGLLLGAVALLLLTLGAWLAARPAVPDGLPSSDEPVARAPQQPSPPSRPADVPPSPPPSGISSGGPPPTPPPGTTVGKKPEPPRANGDEEVLSPGPDTRADRFESQNGEDPEVRTLLSVGDIRMGAVRGSEIRDEAALRTVLVRIGGDLERRMKETRPQTELGFQEILDGYRDEMAKHMNGQIEMRGPGFTIGTEVGPPLPREKWWKPRPQ